MIITTPAREEDNEQVPVTRLSKATVKCLLAFDFLGVWS